MDEEGLFMKKRSLLIALTILMLVGCSGGSKIEENTEKEEYFADEDFLKDLASGLQKRWDKADEYENDDLFTDADAFVEHRIECINIELDTLSKYKDEKFKDSKLQEKVISYINCLNDTLSTMDYAKVDVTKYSEDWDKYYNQRSKLIASFYNDFGLEVEERYKTTLKDFLNNAKAVEYKEQQEEAINSMIEKIQYECIEDSYSWRTYSAIVENTTGIDFNTLNLGINLLDSDDIIIESTYASINNFSSGQKAKIEFSTDKDFTSVDTKVDWYD